VCRGAIGLGEEREHGGVVHLGTIAAIGPSGKSRTAQPALSSGPTSTRGR
jgi:hypothetical protein